ncbi:glycosyltransferase [uncultured Olleya sp.]|uniref:glycosyltransferase family 4 protein n=1 Tax=uncultured Olleya sp. TaxID=757243 RepID=UPI0025917BD0|nr:glycosyltransferase [uncultured Olleya sp.]
MNKKVLIIGPLPEPTTGVSLANKVVSQNLAKRKGYIVNAINTSYYKFDESLGLFSLNKLFFYLKLNCFVYKLLKADIVYVTPGQTFFGVVKYALFFITSKMFNKELIIHVHGNHIGKEYTLLNGFKKKIFKILLSKTSKGIVLSESLTGNMSPFIEKDDIYVLYNFVEDYLFLDKETIEKKIKIDKPKIIFLSNLMQEKGIFDLLEALLVLEARNIAYEAKIAGQIDSKNKIIIESYFERLQFTEYVGVVSGESKKELLLWANIFTLPTYYAMEGQPISILENMATANVILTTNHAGIPDVFQDKVNGYLVKKNDPKSIVDAILRCQSDQENAISIMKNNYKVAKSKYRVKNFIDNILNIFEKEQ